jgi:hypothetical protein
VAVAHSSDRESGSIILYDRAGKMSGTMGAYSDIHDGEFQGLSGLAVDACGNLLAVDTTARIQVFAADGRHLLSRSDLCCPMPTPGDVLAEDEDPRQNIGLRTHALGESRHRPPPLPGIDPSRGGMMLMMHMMNAASHARREVVLSEEEMDTQRVDAAFNICSPKVAYREGAIAITRGNCVVVWLEGREEGDADSEST